MSFGFSNPRTCNTLPDDTECNGCGWKCECVECTPHGSYDTSNECHCTCRFWIVVCFLVAFGFLAVFFVAILYKRVLLCFMSAMTVLIAASLATLALLTDECVWPAFFAVTLVFTFPCVYSCCLNHQSRAAEVQVPASMVDTSVAVEGELDSDRDKPQPAVIIQSPGGEFQIGMEVEMKEMDGLIVNQNGGGSVATTSLNLPTTLDQSVVDSTRPLNPN
eukprot:g8708.t1